MVEGGGAGPEGERRAHPRVAAELAVRVTGEDGSSAGHTRNLSEDGVSLELDGAVGDVRRLRIEIELAEMGWHVVDAEGMRVERDGSRLAARVAELAAAGEREAIRGFLARYLPG